jgi:hypothetical protein
MNATLYSPASKVAAEAAPSLDNTWADRLDAAPQTGLTELFGDEPYFSSTLPGLRLEDDLNTTATVRLGPELYQVTISHPDMTGVAARQELVSYTTDGQPCADVTVYFSEGHSTAGAVNIDKAPLVFIATLSAGLTAENQGDPYLNATAVIPGPSRARA